MVKLAIELGRYDTLVFGRVLEQDESLRQKEGLLLRHWFSGDRRFTIDSSYGPSLDEYRLHIRGKHASRDNEEFWFSFDTKEEAIQYVEYIRKGVAAINAEGKDKTDVAVVQLERIE